MLHPLNIRGCASLLLFPLLFAVAHGSARAQDTLPMPVPRAQNTVTNLLGLTQLIDSNERIVGDVYLEGTVCAATDPAIGVIILQDATDVVLMELGTDQPKILAGEKIRVEGK